MAYLSQQALADRFGTYELEQLAPDGSGGIDPTKINAAIADAGNEIDIYLTSGGYPLPLTPVPPVIEAYACDVARYRLYDDEATEQVNKRYEQALKFLKAVAKGEIRLSANHQDLSSSNEAVGEAVFVSNRPTFPGGSF
ncbi:gp436 family protein [Spongiibacter sp. UBA1325]|uniref:gp436 family protein n=1 Tax=Spongiibacter sp. UBA1325 TaxID=1947543 RepID=UPI00257E6C6F|nr:DUF1320 domain-containing protein [Spongiibacter sp. UBA1325]|tara:strand:- start:3771 stop:4187 length:417 start_codon:yes stop_codon:yes gene_type:complete